MIDMNKHIYLYRVTLTMKDAEKYYYVGIRSCKCEPEDDTEYLGSPKTYKHMWDLAETIKKDIIIILPHNKENHENLSAKELKLIKEAHTRYGLKGKDDGGKCLNAGMFPYFLSTEESRASLSASRKEYLNDNPDVLAKQIANMHTPEAHAKHSASLKKYLNDNPDALAKLIANLNTPEARAKRSSSRKKYLNDNPDVLAKQIANLNTPEARAKHSARVKDYYKNNPDALAKRIANFHSPEARAKRIANKKTCVVCNKTMFNSHFIQHNHGENCKRG